MMRKAEGSTIFGRIATWPENKVYCVRLGKHWRNRLYLHNVLFSVVFDFGSYPRHRIPVVIHPPTWHISRLAAVAIFLITAVKLWR